MNEVKGRKTNTVTNANLLRWSVKMIPKNLLKGSKVPVIRQKTISILLEIIQNY